MANNPNIKNIGKKFSKEYQPKNNGRPKRSFAKFIDKCKEKGYEPITKHQYTEALSFLFSLEEEDISFFADDEKQPLALRLLIAEMTDERTRSNALKDFRDYMFGKAQQSIDHTAKVEITKPPIKWIKDEPTK